LTIIYGAKRGKPAFAGRKDKLSDLTQHFTDYLKANAGKIVNLPTDYLFHNSFLREQGDFLHWCDIDFQFIP